MMNKSYRFFLFFFIYNFFLFTSMCTNVQIFFIFSDFYIHTIFQSYILTVISPFYLSFLLFSYCYLNSCIFMARHLQQKRQESGYAGADYDAAGNVPKRGSVTPQKPACRSVCIRARVLSAANAAFLRNFSTVSFGDDALMKTPWPY